MAITLKKQEVLKDWSTVVDWAAGNSGKVLEDIQLRLSDSRIPGNCHWHIQEVKTEKFIGRVRRTMIVVQLKQYKDYMMYICIRDYGAHLDCSWFFTLEISSLKKWMSAIFTGKTDTWSKPRNILAMQDLRAWSTVVESAVRHSVKSMVTELGKEARTTQRGDKDFLEDW